MKIFKSTFDKIMASYPNVPPENGGILGSKNGILCEYIHDKSLQSYDEAIYVPDIVFLNKCIERWKTNNVAFAGMIHSHKRGEEALSTGDLQFIKKIMISTEIQLFFPIIIPRCRMISYRATKEAGKLVIKKDNIEFVFT